MDSDSTNVFGFMSLRPIRQSDPAVFAQPVIRDDSITPANLTNSIGNPPPGRRIDVDLFSGTSPSALGRSVFRLVSRNASVPSIALEAERLLLRGYDRSLGTASRSFRPVLQSATFSAKNGLLLSDLSGRPHYVRQGSAFILPGSLADVDTPMPTSLTALRLELQSIFRQIAETRSGGTTTLSALASYNANPSHTQYPLLVDMVFSRQTGSFATDFAIARRAVFDAFYGLYILRKVYPLRLDPIIEALQTLHALERLALYLFCTYAVHTRGDAAAQADIQLLERTLTDIYPALLPAGIPEEKLDGHFDAIGLPLRVRDALSEGPLSAQPVIHPLFSRLARDFVPFNDLKPVGIGDLMVVTQKFRGYRKGEIAHIETVLAGETKSTVHRRLDRSEATQSYTSTEEAETSTDRQSTSRYELKNEAETVLKTDFGAALGTTLTYDNKVVVASVTASANLALSRSDTTRLAANFARDITEKAVTKVQRRIAEQRSRTVLAETEITNRHDFTNPAANGNISGIYRWIDKVYQAEVRNYGRRLMFELMIPEPAAFFVQQRLLEYAATLDLPKYPKKEISAADDEDHDPPVTNASQISREKFAELNQTYMLDDLTPPPQQIEGIAVLDSTGNRTFTMTSPYKDNGIKSDVFYGCRLAQYPRGYNVVSFAVQGSLQFASKHETDPNWQNTLRVRLDNTLVFDVVNEDLIFWRWPDPVQQQISVPLAVPIALVSIETKTCQSYNLTFSATAELAGWAFAEWQQRVFENLTSGRLRKTGTGGDPVEDPDLVAYRSALKEITKPDVRSLLQGRSSDWNTQVVKRELRRQAISQVTKEFGTDSRAHELTNLDAMGTLGVGSGYSFPDLTVTPGTQNAPVTSAKMEARTFPTDGYVVPDIELSRRKGNHIQFIEHAFEWEHLSFVFYPYYWSTPPRWVELLSREDDADPAFTEFLQAGAARVLLAVRPGFETSVMHYLATREPWDGGAAPVIGDPLHLPVHMEIRGRQDDYAGSERVGDPWLVTVPTSLVYLESEKFPLPDEFDPNAPMS